MLYKSRSAVEAIGDTYERAYLAVMNHYRFPQMITHNRELCRGAELLVINRDD